MTLCGRCEWADREAFGAGQAGGIRLQRENVAASPGYQAIERWCGAQGWMIPAIKTKRVLERRALLREHVEGTIVQSIRVRKRGGKGSVETLEYVDIARF